MCNVPSLVSLLAAVPSLPPTARAGRAGHEKCFQKCSHHSWFLLQPHSFTHPHALVIIPSSYLVGVASREGHGPFWTAPGHPAWQNLGRSLVLTSHFIPCHYLFLFCIKRFFFPLLISYFLKISFVSVLLPELLQEHCINSGSNATNTRFVLKLVTPLQVFCFGKFIAWDFSI